MNTKKTYFILLLILGLSIIACGQLSVGIEPPEATANETLPASEETPETNAATQGSTDHVRTETDQPDYSDLWVEVEDYRTGLRFAIPCFWVANIPAPEQDPTGLGSFSVENFTQEYIATLRKASQMVFEIGGVKFDIGYHQLSDYGLAPGTSLEELAVAIVNSDEEHGITSTSPMKVNGEEALKVDTFSIFGEGQFYLFPLFEGMVVMFSPSDDEHPDIQAILQSMTIDLDADMVKPSIMPADPPEGMAAACIGKMNAGSPDENPLEGTLDCAGVTDADALRWVMCNVQDSFISRNTQPLLGYMADPFIIGYWQSEGAERSREDAFNEIVNTHMPVMGGGMSFTTDQSQFPPLFDMQAEMMFGPEDNPAAIVYSEGWGQAGQGAALLYFKERADGRYVFYAMVIAQGHFDK
ncbi:MAG: hypothetical protein JW757_13845 [Anaerolineales bacterium]|nr:hypothetical protein [Anaerolineales bacterium]